MLGSPTIAQSLVPAATFVRPTVRQDPENPGVIEVTFRIHDEHAPSFRSAVEEFSNLLATRLEQPHLFSKEKSLTNAVIAFGALRAAVNRLVKKSDPFYA